MPIGIIIGIVLLTSITIAAMLIYFERRMLSLWQDRLGPNRTGWQGLLQVPADMIKIFLKEDWVPPFADKWVFVIAPAIVMSMVLLTCALIPFAPNILVANANVGLLFFFAFSSLSAYSIVLAGWASNNKYSLIGAMRGSAQMIAYEVFMGLSLMGVVMLAGSFSFKDIVESQRNMWNVIPQFVGFVIFLIAAVAESHRAPFDIPEAEGELIAGFHTEYSGIKFGMFFVGEYLGVFMISALITTLFFGGYIGPSFLPPIMWFLLKTFFFICFIILLRAALPRPRYDQLVEVGWKLLLPLTLINVLVTAAVLLVRAG